jgi:hypothetical protein
VHKPRLLILLLLASTAHVAVADDAARSYLKLATANDADCVALQGQMRQLINTHSERAIEAYLYRRMGDVVQPGRMVETVPPGGKRINLGCTRMAGGYAQDWDIIKAEFRK